MTDISVKYLPLKTLQKHERNPKEHDIGEINASISRFGFVSPIIIDEKSGKIVAGHGRLDTLIEMKGRGSSPPERVKKNGKDWMVPVILGISFEDDHEAEAYLLADNKVSEIGGWNDEELEGILKDHGEDLDGMGFDLEDLGGDYLRREKPDKEAGEVEFTEELFERSNYVVLYFDNEVDWLQAVSVLDIESVRALDSTDNHKKIGIGRVVNGPKAINKIVEAVKSKSL